MKNNLLTVFVAFCLLVLNLNQANAQCPYAGNISQFPAGIVTPTCDGTPFEVTNCNFGGDYFLLDVIAGNQYLISTCGGGFDSQLSVYDEATQTLIAYNDDFGPGCASAQASVQFVATFSGLVRVLVNEYFCASNFTCIPVTVTCDVAPPAPANNDCASVVPVPMTVPGTEAFLGTTAGSTDNSIGQTYGAAQVWEAITITECANLAVSLCTTDPVFTDMFIGISSGCPAEFPTNFIFANNFNFTDCSDGNFTANYFNLPAGTYYIPVIGDAPNDHDYILTVTASTCASPPSNDDCFNAISVSCGDFVTGSTLAAASDANSPLCNLFTMGNGVWYEITGTGDVIIVDLSGSDYDTQLSIYDGDCNNLSCVASNDDANGFQSLASFQSTAGVTYYILVHGYNTAIGNYNMSVICATAPPNNDCANVTPYNLSTPGTVTFTGNSLGSTDNSLGQSYGSAQVWEAITLDNCANLVIDYCGTSPTFVNTFIGISTGCPAEFPGNYLMANSFDFLTCPDGNPTVYFNNLAPGTYYIPVFGDAPDNHAYTMNVVSTPTFEPPVITPASLPEICNGSSIELNITNAGTLGEFEIVISGIGFLDEVSWTLNDANNITVASGGNYAQGSTNTVVVTVSNGPFTFTVSTLGFWNDNVADYSITCLSTGTLIASGTLQGGLTDSYPGINCVGTFDYTWSPIGTLDTGVGTTVNATPSSTTTYTATVTNPNTGCFSSSDIEIVVNQPASLTFDPAAPYACAGSSVQITVSGATTYTWSPSSILDTDQGDVVNASPSQLETLTVDAIDANGCLTSGTVDVDVKANPTMNLVSGGTFCPGAEGTVEVLLGGEMPFDFSIIVNGVTQDITGYMDTSYIVTSTTDLMVEGLSVTDAYCNTALSPMEMAMLAPPVQIVFDPIADICITSSPVTLGAQPAGGVFSGNNVNNGIFDPSGGSEQVTYEYTDQFGCQWSDATNINVNSAPDVSVLGPNNICEKDNPVTLVGSPAGGVFSGPGVNAAGLFNPLTAGPGLHVITYVFTDATGCDGTGTISINVSPNPVPSISIPTTTCINYSPFSLSGTPSGGTFAGPGVTGSMFNPQTAGLGNASIIYTVTNAAGCSGSVTQQITVNECAGLDDYSVAMGAEIYPNPTSSFTTLELYLPVQMDVNVRILTQDGKIVSQGLLKNLLGEQLIQLKVQDFASGMYFVVIQGGNHTISKKLIVK